MKLNLASAISAVKNSIKKVFWRAIFHFRRGAARAVLDVKTKPKRGIAGLLAAGIAYWYFGISAALLWLLFLLFLVYGWENRIVGVLALIALAACPILISLWRDDLAEIMAVYAYWFLTMTVALQIAEYRRENVKCQISNDK